MGWWHFLKHDWVSMYTSDVWVGFGADDPLHLDSGGTLSPVELAYETHGQLSPQRDNAILICHALTGNAHVASIPGQPPGWWDGVVGPGKAIDTNRFFVVCSNVIGGCAGSTGPSSLNPHVGVPYGIQFPVITIGDMVRAQHALLTDLGIPQWHAVIGGSMGGMQALEWACMYPQQVNAVIAIASTAKLSPQALAFDSVGRHAILSDPHWNNGFYYGLDVQPHDGLAIARMIGHITYLSDEAMRLKFGRNLQQRPDYGYDFNTEFQVESYLLYQGDKFVNRFDANSYLYLTKAVNYFDLEKKYGSLEQAFDTSSARFLVVSIDSDWLYPPHQSKELASTLMKLNKQVSYANLASPYGHDAFLMDNPPLNDLVAAFLCQ